MSSNKVCEASRESHYGNKRSFSVLERYRSNTQFSSHVNDISIKTNKYIILLNFKLTLKTYLPEKRNLLSVVANVLFHVPDI